MKERIVIVLVAIGLGLFLTTIGFLVYQSTKFKPLTESASTEQESNPENDVTPTVSQNSSLLIVEPKDETVTDRRSVKVKGETDPGNTIVVSSNQEDVVATPDSSGKFTANITIDAGINKLITRAIKPDGTEEQVIRIVTYTSEEF